MYAWYFTNLVANDIAVIPVGAKAIKYRTSSSGSNIDFGAIISSSSVALNDSTEVVFPIVKNMSPNSFKIVTVGSSAENTSLTIIVNELGGTPDPYYFERDENGIIPQEAIQARQAARIVYPTRLTAKEVADLMNGGELSSVESTPRTHPTLEPKVTEDAQSTTATVKTKTK